MLEFSPQRAQRPQRKFREGIASGKCLWSALHHPSIKSDFCLILHLCALCDLCGEHTTGEMDAPGECAGRSRPLSLNRGYTAPAWFRDSALAGLRLPGLPFRLRRVMAKCHSGAPLAPECWPRLNTKFRADPDPWRFEEDPKGGMAKLAHSCWNFHHREHRGNFGKG